MNVVWEGAKGWNGLTVSIAAKAKLAFALWLPVAQGVAPMVAGLGSGAAIGKAGSLVPGATFRIDADAAAVAFGGAMTEYLLPNGVAVVQSGMRWSVAGGAKGLTAGVLSRSRMLWYNSMP